MHYSMSEIVPENGGYGYTLHGPQPIRCFSRLYPDLKKIHKSLQRLNQTQPASFNNLIKKSGGHS